MHTSHLRLLVLGCMLFLLPYVAAGQGPKPVAQHHVTSQTKSAPDLTALRASIHRGMTPGERGALVGGIIGAATGIVLAIAYADGNLQLGSVLIATVVFAIPGVVIGGLVGSAAGKGKE